MTNHHVQFDEGTRPVRGFRERYAALNPERRSLAPRESTGLPIELLETGVLLRNHAGEIFVAETHHAEPRLAALRSRPALESRLYFAQAANGSITPADILFLDTETTGLAGGTGTHAFLVGAGHFDLNGFVLKQYFMRSPADEVALLEELRGLLEQFPVVVTFNGKSFDWPLLDTRFLMHGYRLKFHFTHLDLLHPARRIWKHRLASCSLSSLEQQIFGIQRTGDVPGFLIPQLYFDYLRDGDARRLQPIFSHNREDIITLARLLETLLLAESAPDQELVHPEDQIGMALALLAAGETERGYLTLSRALESEQLDPATRRRGQLELWRLMKRAGKTHDGIAMLEAMCADAARSRTTDLYPFVELAKFYEHVVRDYPAAERVVERAMLLIELRSQTLARAELLHRLQRIQRKRLLSR